MTKDKKFITIVISLLLIFASIIIFFNTEIRDITADKVDGTETIWINTTDYVPIYYNDTIWINSTEYIPLWYNTTQYINSTIWINGTEWINTTEYIYILVYVPVWYNSTIWINTTTFIDYPFVTGWDTPGNINYIRMFKSSSNYRILFWDQINLGNANTGYMPYGQMLTILGTFRDDGYISLQQYDCAYLQLKILSG